MTRLMLLRHAKSDWSDGTLSDHDRPLNARGREAAALMGRYIRDQHLLPDLILCSTARRAAETCVRMQAAGDVAATVAYDRRLYLATPQQMLAVAAERADGAKTLMLIGHNPGMEECAGRVAATGDKALLVRMREKFPTAALAVIDFPGGWDTVKGPRPDGRLAAFVVPREIA